jgi:hypothetical protein
VSRLRFPNIGKNSSKGAENSSTGMKPKSAYGPDIKMTEERNNPNEKKELRAAIDAACGTCEENPIDADVIRKDSNESGRGIPAS